MRNLQRTILMALFTLSSVMIFGCTTGGKTATAGKEVIAPPATDPSTDKAANDKGDPAIKPAASAEVVPTQPSSAELESSAAQVETAITAAEASAAVSAQKTNTADGRRIWFVKENSVAIYAEPKADAKVVGHMARGDHVLATVDGAWATVDRTQYIKAEQLSDKPVGRAKITKKKWDGSPAH